MPHIEIRVNKRTGKILTEAEGYCNGECAPALDTIERILGLYVTTAKDKEETICQMENLQMKL